MNKTVRPLIAALAIAIVPAITVAQGEDGREPNERATYFAAREDALEVQRKALEAPSNDDAFEAFLELLPRSGDLFVVEGDIFLSEEGVREYLHRRAARDPQPAPGGELVVQRDSAGNRLILPRDRRDLEYAFDTASFPSADMLEATVILARAAARGWEDACFYTKCGVSFAHRRKLDGNPVPGQGVDFVIRFNRDLGSNVLARAFFPNDPKDVRFLDVAPVFFTSGLSRLGIMIHEFGHVLGYWHEHLLGDEAGCFVSPLWQDFIDTSLEALPVPGQPAVQDRLSPMHYPCGTVADYADVLSPRDIAAHGEAYGQ